MWTKCPDCKKKDNYNILFSWLAKGERKQCEKCRMNDKLERQRWENEGGCVPDREVECRDGQHISIDGATDSPYLVNSAG